MEAVLGTTYFDHDWEHGLACMDCLHVFREGDQYAERLYAFADDAPMVEVVCVACATAGEPGR
jgi:hypothetical protein